MAEGFSNDFPVQQLFLSRKEIQHEQGITIEDRFNSAFKLLFFSFFKKKKGGGIICINKCKLNL